MKNLTSLPQPPSHYQAIGSDGDSSSSPVQNPFASETQTLASRSSSDRLSYQSENDHDAYQSHATNSVVQREYGNDYEYNARSPPPVPPHGPGLSRGNMPLQANLSRNSSQSLMGSSEFDRYPNRLSSAAPSITSGGASLIPPGEAPFRSQFRHSAQSDQSGSSASSLEQDYSRNNPFVVNADFSPFGGYPASSFPLHLDEKEADDYLHNPDPILDAKYNRRCQ